MDPVTENTREKSFRKNTANWREASQRIKNPDKGMNVNLSINTKGVGSKGWHLYTLPDNQGNIRMLQILAKKQNMQKKKYLRKSKFTSILKTFTNNNHREGGIILSCQVVLLKGGFKKSFYFLDLFFFQDFITIFITLSHSFAILPLQFVFKGDILIHS